MGYCKRAEGESVASAGTGWTGREVSAEGLTVKVDQISVRTAEVPKVVQRRCSRFALRGVALCDLSSPASPAVAGNSPEISRSHARRSRWTGGPWARLRSSVKNLFPALPAGISRRAKRIRDVENYSIARPGCCTTARGGSRDPVVCGEFLP